MRWLATICTALAGPAVVAETVSFEAVRDNTLYFDLSGAVSNGLGPTFFAGRNAGNATRRGLLAFDLSAIPAEAVIEAVSLRLFLSQAQPFPTAVTLHRLTSDWGEGASNAGVRGGAGTTATTGDATWIHSFRPGNLWTLAGGDFLPSASASTPVAEEGAFYTWANTPALTADVQSWLEQPAQNFGWIIRGDETQSATAKAFASHEAGRAAERPQLTVSYSLIPEPHSLLLAVAGGLVCCRRPRQASR